MSLPVFLVYSGRAHAQGMASSTRTWSWLAAQAIPSVTFYSGERTRAWGLEWEATPIIYSFGMNRKISPFHFWIVEPPARFTGSIELKLAGQLFFHAIGSSHWGASAELLGHVPLIERGERLTLDLGAGVLRTGRDLPIYAVVGASTLFGLLAVHVKYSPSPRTWLGSLEFRFF